MNTLKFVAIIFVFVAAFSCKKKDDKEVKKVTLNTPATISDSYVIDYAPSVNTNYGNDEKIYCVAWTYSGTPTKCYFLLKFDYSSIPSGATIKSAKLSLFSNLHSSFPTGTGTDTIGHYGPQYSTNLDWSLKRITNSWEESTVNYTTRPGTSETNKLSMASPSAYNTNYIDIDVTQLVKDQRSSGNYGFEASLNDYTPYKRLHFCSSEYSKDAARLPSLTIEYEQ